MKRKDFEVMAPVGSYESLEAALQAGRILFILVEGLICVPVHRLISRWMI